MTTARVAVHWNIFVVIDLDLARCVQNTTQISRLFHVQQVQLKEEEVKLEEADRATTAMLSKLEVSQTHRSSWMGDLRRQFRQCRAVCCTVPIKMSDPPNIRSGISLTRCWTRDAGKTVLMGAHAYIMMNV